MKPCETPDQTLLSHFPREAKESGSRRSIEDAFWSRTRARNLRRPIEIIYLTRCEASQGRDFRFWFGFWINGQQLDQELWSKRVTELLSAILTLWNNSAKPPRTRAFSRPETSRLNFFNCYYKTCKNHIWTKKTRNSNVNLLKLQFQLRSHLWTSI